MVETKQENAKQKVVAVDFETPLISYEMPIPYPICLSYAYSDADFGLLVGIKDIELFLKKVLEDENILIVAHNATFELCVIFKEYKSLRELLWKSLEQGRWYCTYLSRVLSNNTSKKSDKLNQLNLAALVMKYFSIDCSEGKTDPDAWRYRYVELENVPLEDWPQPAIDYAIMDSIYALRLYHVFSRHREQDQQQHIISSFTLNYMASRGLVVDMDRVRILDDELEQILKPMYESLISQGFMHYQTVKKTGKQKIKKETKKLQEYVQANIPAPETTSKGNIVVKRETLQKYLRQVPGDPVIQEFEKLAEYEKLKSAFLSRLLVLEDPIFGEPKLMRTQYDVIKETGRTSSRKSNAFPSVNIQQQPR